MLSDMWLPEIHQLPEHIGNLSSIKLQKKNKFLHTVQQSLYSTAHSLNEYKTYFSSSSTFLNRVNYSLSLYLCSLKQLLQMFTSIIRILEIYKYNKNNVINKNGPQQQSDRLVCTLNCHQLSLTN